MLNVPTQRRQCSIVSPNKIAHFNLCYTHFAHSLLFYDWCQEFWESKGGKNRMTKFDQNMEIIHNGNSSILTMKACKAERPHSKHK